MLRPGSGGLATIHYQDMTGDKVGGVGRQENSGAL